MADTALESGPRSLTEDGRPRLNTGQVLFFNRQLASMARLNMPLAKGIKILAKEVDEPAFKQVLLTVQRDLEEGLPLSQALAKYPESFTSLYLEVLRAGESTGNLASILDELSSYSESMMKVKSRILEALMYPAVISSFIFGFSGFFLVYIAPRFQNMLSDTAGSPEKVAEVFARLPWPTKVIFALSDFARNPIISVGVIIAVITIAFYLIRTFQRMGDSYDEFLLQLPVFGKLFHRAALMKLTRTMRELLVNGVSMVQTLRLTTNIVGRNRIQKKLRELTDAVEEGGSFSRNLASGDVFPDTMVWKLQMAEEKGIVEDALKELAIEFEAEVDTMATMITKLLSPLMLVFMSGIVFFLFVATFMPLTQLSSIAAG